MTPVDHVVAIGGVLDSLDIGWVLGGSLASSIVGEPRSTMDVDIAIRIGADLVERAVSDAFGESPDQDDSGYP